MLRFLFFSTLVVSSFLLRAQKSDSLSIDDQDLDPMPIEMRRDKDSIPEKTFSPVLIEATRAGDKTPVTYLDLTQKELEPLNNGQDLPYALRFTPSMVVTSDAGNGIGYTGLWIRGSDPSRINVTINGIPLNDPESQQVFWVNTPDLISGTGSVQVQRGVGTSANGSSAFGGAIKLETLNGPLSSYAQVSNTIGSFNTVRNNIRFATGLLGGHFSLEGRLSNIQSDGYIDRASTDLKSYYFSGSYSNERTKIVLTNFSGREQTYQSWNGTPAEKLNGASEQDLVDFGIRNGFNQQQIVGLINSGRTYNYYDYSNQVDHYGQDHYQMHVRHLLSEYLTLNIAGHYTRGKGYFEEFKYDQSFDSYGLKPISIVQAQSFSDGLDSDGNPISSAFSNQITNNGISIYQSPVLNQNGDTITDGQGNVLLDLNAQIDRSDIVRRRWLDNKFYGGVFSLMYQKGSLAVTLGGAYNEYLGQHFGEIIWMRYAGGVGVGDRYYNGRSKKTDGNMYGKASYSIAENVDVYADLQVRSVHYKTGGMDNDLRSYDVDDHLVFFNPKAGVNWRLDNKQRVYCSAAVGNKEPNRNDYVDAYQGVKPKREHMIDIEAGYQINRRHFLFGINLYAMEYKDQLVLTGELNDVGAPLRTNAKSSYRRGIETDFGYRITNWLNVYGNLTLSRNKIKEFNEVLYDYTNGFDVVNVNHKNTDISFSPSVISSAGVTFNLWSQDRSTNETTISDLIELSAVGKFVGRQFLDNTSDEGKIINDYTVMDLRLTFTMKREKLSELKFHVWANNVLNRYYSSNGYTYSYIYGARVTERFYYPQAGVNFLVGLSLTF